MRIPLLLLVSLCACATLVVPDKARIPIRSEPPGATVVLNGREVGITPLHVVIDTHREHAISLKKTGYLDGQCDLTTTVGAGYLIVDILLLPALLPIVIDAARSAWSTVDQEMCSVTLRPRPQ